MDAEPSPAATTGPYDSGICRSQPRARLCLAIHSPDVCAAPSSGPAGHLPPRGKGSNRRRPLIFFPSPPGEKVPEGRMRGLRTDLEASGAARSSGPAGHLPPEGGRSQSGADRGSLFPSPPGEKVPEGRMRGLRDGPRISDRAQSGSAPGPRRPNPLLNCRRRAIIEVGRAVVGQALEIGPDQGFVGWWGASVLAVIELRGQHDDEVVVVPCGPEDDPAARATECRSPPRFAAWRRWS